MKTILISENGLALSAAITLTQKYGDDIRVMTIDDAKEVFSMEDFAKAEAEKSAEKLQELTKTIATADIPYRQISGQESRRERRKRERKNKS